MFSPFHMPHTLVLRDTHSSSFPMCRMKKPCLTYKVWQERDGRTFGKAVVVKFSPWEEKEEEGSWSDVRNIVLHTYTCVCIYGGPVYYIYIYVYLLVIGSVKDLDLICMFVV